MAFPAKVWPHGEREVVWSESGRAAWPEEVQRKVMAVCPGPLVPCYGR